jgi:hypothetical protein
MIRRILAVVAIVLGVLAIFTSHAFGVSAPAPGGARRRDARRGNRHRGLTGTPPCFPRDLRGNLSRPRIESRGSREGAGER